MSRLQQNQLIQTAIDVIDLLLMDQCSLSDDEIQIAGKLKDRLFRLKKKKGKTNEQIRKEISEVLFLTIQLFI